MNILLKDITVAVSQCGKNAIVCSNNQLLLQILIY